MTKPRGYCPLQQAIPCWTGGHGTEPYEQNTQQSPAFGLTTAAHAGQSRKNWQASVGIVIVLTCPQCGQVSWQSSFNAVWACIWPESTMDEMQSSHGHARLAEGPELRKAITDAGYTVVAIRRSDESLDAVRNRVSAKVHAHD